MKRSAKSSPEPKTKISEKQGYEPPKLIRYGKLKELTAGGGAEGLDSLAQQVAGGS